MAGSGGSFEDDEIDFDNGEDLNGFASSPPGSSHGSNGYDAAQVYSPSPRRDSFFMTEPEHDSPQDFQSPDEHQKDVDDAELEEEGLGPLKPRGRIIGNGFDRPIHRQTSLAEFENLESLLKDQSQGSPRGDGRFIQEDGGHFGQEDDQFLQENGQYHEHGGQHLDEEGWSDEEGMGYEGGGDHHQSRHFDDGGDIDSTHEGEQYVEGTNRDGGVDDLMKYMQATPRNDQELPSEQMHRLSRVMDISYDNDSLDDRGAGDVNDAIFPQSSSHQDFFSLSQEQIPEQPSHLVSEEEDVSDMFSRDGDHSIQPRENLSTIIKAAAANIETFGSGDSPEGRGADSSGGGIEHFKPIATSNRRPSKPQTAVQLRDQERLNSGQNSAVEQTSGSEQSSQGSQGSVRNALSARSQRTHSQITYSQRTRSSRAGTPRSGVSSRSRSSSFESVHSEGGHPSSYRESLGQLTPRSSTPGHDSTLVRQDSEFSPSPVRQSARKTSEVIPRLRLDNISGRSDRRSDESDVEPLDRTTKSRLVSDDFVDQLQKEYDELLQKHAQAENTIDTLRLGAKIRLEYEGQPGGQSGRSAASPLKHGQTINLPHGQKGLMSSADSGLPHTPGMNRIVHVHTSSPGSHRPSIASAGEHHMLPPDASEGELLALQFQLQGHKEQMDSFDILLQENHLSLPDQERGLGGLRSGQSKLEADFMQAKEEHTAKARLGSARGHPPVTFDPEQEVAGQIFQLGMRLEKIQEAVQENRRNNPPEPWLPTTRRAEHDGKAPGIAMATESISQDGGGSRREKAQAGPTPEEEYALLLSRYDALKQRPPHPDRDREIQRLVKSLQDMPDFAVGTDHPANDGSPGQDVSSYHDNEADIEPEIALIDHRHDVEDDHDHDGDVDGSSVHSSQFREMTSPEVFRPKGTAPHDLPRWQPPVTGSMSSLASPDNEAPPSSIHSRKKSTPGKPNGRQPQPRADAGDTRRGKTSQGAPRGHLEPGEGDSGFVGSESSRQSQKTRLSEGRSKNRSQRLPVSHEVTKDAPSRESRLPVRQHGSNRTPLQGRNGTVPLRQQAVPEEEDSIYSGGSRRTKKPQPQYEQPIRDTRPPVHKSQITPPRTKDSMQHRHQRTPVIPSQKERQPHHNQSLPLSSQYLQRTSNERENKTPVPKRRNDQRVEPLPQHLQGRSDRLQGASRQRAPSRQQGMTYSQLKMSPRQPETDRRSDVTRSSVRTEALQALQDEVNQLRSRMADGRRNQTSPPATIPEEWISRSRTLPPYPVDEDDGASTRSSKSEMLQMLQEEIAELKDRVEERDPETRTPHVTTSTPLRDSMREALMDRYIPGRNASFGASPIRASPQKFGSRRRVGDMSSVRSPPRMGASTRSPLWARGSSNAPSSPPPVSGFSGQYQSPAPRSVPCSSCGGTGTHTHGDYQYPPPPTTYSPAPQQAYTPVQGTPSQTPVYPQSQTMSYIQTPTVSYVQPPTMSYVQPPASPTFAPPNVAVPPQNVASAPPTHGQSYVYVQSSPASAPQNASTVPQVTQQTPTASGPQTILLGGQSQSRTPSNVHPDARPVYLLSSEKRGRYYIRDDTTNTSGSGGEEEFYYRRTPRSGRTRTSSSSRTGSRHGTPRSARQPKVVERIPAALQVTLDDAVHMAERLKQTSNHMMSSMRHDVHLAESFNAY